LDDQNLKIIKKNLKKKNFKKNNFKKIIGNDEIDSIIKELSGFY
jgi:hypothetical protein